MFGAGEVLGISPKHSEAGVSSGAISATLLLHLEELPGFPVYGLGVYEFTVCGV